MYRFSPSVGIGIEAKWEKEAGSKTAPAELVAGPTGMIRLETTVEELAHTVHPHPTLSEVVMEAAHVALGQPVHL